MRHFASEDAKAEQLREFRRAFLKREPKAILQWFKMAANASSWGNWDGLKYSLVASELPDLEWLRMRTPEKIGSYYSGAEELGEADRYEEGWLKWEEESKDWEGVIFGIDGSDVEGMLNAFMNDAITCDNHQDRKLFDRNIATLNLHIQSALELEAELIAEAQRHQQMQEAKRASEHVEWEQQYGICTRRSPYEDTFYEDHFPVKRSEYIRKKNQIKADSILPIAGPEWIDQMDAKFIAPLRFMTEEELNYLKENHFLAGMEFPEDVDRELGRRKELGFAQKIFEGLFVRVRS